MTGVVAWAADRARMVMAFIALSLLAGGFAFGQITGVRIDDYLVPTVEGYSTLLSVVGLFVAIILFEGGLTLKFRELRESGRPHHGRSKREQGQPSGATPAPSAAGAMS